MPALPQWMLRTRKEIKAHSCRLTQPIATQQSGAEISESSHLAKGRVGTRGRTAPCASTIFLAMPSHTERIKLAEPATTTPLATAGFPTSRPQRAFLPQSCTPFRKAHHKTSPASLLPGGPVASLTGLA